MTFNPDIIRMQMHQQSVEHLDAGMRMVQSSTPEAAPQVAEQGVAMGYRLETETNPAQELMDSMEELSFQFEETEMKSVSERSMGEARKKSNVYLKALEFWVQMLPDMPDHDAMARILRRIRQGAYPNSQLLLKDLASQSEDPTVQFAMLECLESAGEETGFSEEFKAVLQEAKAQLQKAKGPEIQVGINLATEINSRAANPEEMQGLRDLYRGQVLGFTTPQDCFLSLLAQRGAGRLAESIDFLMKSCSVDLQATTPSTSPEELRRILLDLQCVEVLKTVNERLERLGARMVKQFQETPLLNSEKMTGKILDMTRMPFVNSSTVSSFVNSCGLKALMTQLDFMRELNGLFRMLSPRLFEDNAARFRMVDASQEYLDELVAKEEEEEKKKPRQERKNKEGRQ